RGARHHRGPAGRPARTSRTQPRRPGDRLAVLRPGRRTEHPGHDRRCTGRPRPGAPGPDRVRLQPPVRKYPAGAGGVFADLPSKPRPDPRRMGGLASAPGAFRVILEHALCIGRYRASAIRSCVQPHSSNSLVISLNVQRRDLTAAQRAIVAARALPMFEATKKRGPKSATDSGTSNGRATADASKVFKVGVNAVQQAKAILTNAP